MVPRPLPRRPWLVCCHSTRGRPLGVAMGPALQALRPQGLAPGFGLTLTRRQRLRGQPPVLPGSATTLLSDLDRPLPSLNPSCEKEQFSLLCSLQAVNEMSAKGGAWCIVSQGQPLSFASFFLQVEKPKITAGEGGAPSGSSF